MSMLFSYAFSAIFLAFIVAAIIGHVLLIEALARPFFGGLAVTTPSLTKSSLAPAG